MTIHIFTSVVNRPEFVEIQKKLFDKYLTDKYEFHVVDDSVENDVSLQFKNICDNYSINYYIKNSISKNLNPAQACAEAVQWTYDNLILKKHIRI